MSESVVSLVGIGLLWIVVIVQGIVLWVLRRHYLLFYPSLQRGDLLGGLSVGELAPEFSGLLLGTKQVFDGASLKGRRVTLIFLSASCGSCDAVAAALANDVEGRYGDYLVFCNEANRACAGKFSKLAAMERVLVKQDVDIAAKFRVRNVPTAVVVSEFGVIERVAHYQGLTSAVEWLAKLITNPQRKSPQELQPRLVGE